MKLSRFAIVLLAVSLSAAAARGNEFVRPIDAAELRHSGQLVVDTAVAVPGTRVAYADYSAIRRDFPAVATLSDSEIREWLLKNAAFISAIQRRLVGIRSLSIPVDEARTTKLYRPDGWNRAALMEVKDPGGGAVIGMIDVKGVGHGPRTERAVKSQVDSFAEAAGDVAKLNAIRVSDHSDGLMSLGEAIAETTRQTAAQRLFEAKTEVLETVETYAILSLPTEILKKDGQSIPAALYLRQAHFGRGHGLAVPESIFEDFFGGRQKTDSSTAVDFGGVLIREPALRRNFEILPGANPEDAQSSKAWAWGHDVATAYARRGDIEAVHRHLNEMLGPLGAMSPNAEHLAFRERVRQVLAAQPGVGPRVRLQQVLIERLPALIPISSVACTDALRGDTLKHHPKIRTAIEQTLGLEGAVSRFLAHRLWEPEFEAYLNSLSPTAQDAVRKIAAPFSRSCAKKFAP